MSSAIEPGTTNLQVNPLEPRPEENFVSNQSNRLLNEYMSYVDFDTPFSRVEDKDPVASIPSSTKSKTWHYIERDGEHHKGT